MPWGCSAGPCDVLVVLLLVVFSVYNALGKRVTWFISCERVSWVVAGSVRSAGYPKRWEKPHPWLHPRAGQTVGLWGQMALLSAGPLDCVGLQGPSQPKPVCDSMILGRLGSVPLCRWGSPGVLWSLLVV